MNHRLAASSWRRDAISLAHGSALRIDADALVSRQARSEQLIGKALAKPLAVCTAPEGAEVGACLESASTLQLQLRTALALSAPRRLWHRCWPAPAGAAGGAAADTGSQPPLLLCTGLSLCRHPVAHPLHARCPPWCWP